MSENEYTSPKNITGCDVVIQRLIRRVERRDRKIAGLERKIRRLEDALCNVRMIPVFGGRRERVIAEVKTYPANVD